MIDEGNTRTLIHHYDNCIYCGQCEAYCTTKKGITLSRASTTSPSSTARRPSRRSRRSSCAASTAATSSRPSEHLEWIARKVGSLVRREPDAHGRTPPGARRHDRPVRRRRQGRRPGRRLPGDVPGLQARGLPDGGLAGVGRALRRGRDSAGDADATARCLSTTGTGPSWARSSLTAEVRHWCPERPDSDEGTRSEWQACSADAKQGDQ